MDTTPLSNTQIPAVSPANDNPPKGVIITNKKSLTSLGYSDMNTTAIADMKLMIEAATEKSKDKIGQAIKIAKANALKDVNKEYDSILTELGAYDRTKEALVRVRNKFGHRSYEKGSQRRINYQRFNESSIEIR